jgi:TolB-like protein
MVLLLVAIGLFAWQQFKGGSNEPESAVAETPAVSAALGAKSIAVLPFENFSESDDDAHFSDGLADTVLHRLAQLDDLTVIARNSSFVYKGTNVDIRQVGLELGVANVLEGSVQRQGDRLRVIAQLIETGSGSHLWSETFDRSLSDIFSIQDDIASSVANALQVELLGDEAARLTSTGTDDPIAWGLYLQGVDPENIMSRRYEQRDLLIQAIGRDPKFVEAYLGLARIYDLIAWQASSPAERTEALENGFESIDRAIALDPGNPEILKALGSLRRRNGETLEAVAVLTSYLEKNRNDADAHMMTGLALHNSGRFKEAYAHFESGYRLNPKRTILMRQLGFTSVHMGEVERGIDWYRKGIDLPGSASFFYTDLARIEGFMLGRWEVSVNLLGDVLAQHPENDSLPGDLISHALAMGLDDQAEQLLAWMESKPHDPARVARLRANQAAYSGNIKEQINVQLASESSGDPFWGRPEFQAWVCLSEGDFACALEALRPAGAGITSGFSPEPFFASMPDVDLAARLGLAELKAGDPALGRRLLQAVLDVTVKAPLQGGDWGGPISGRANSEAELRAALGDSEGALAALEASLPDDGESYIRHGILKGLPIERSPYLESIRDHPRFKAYVAEILRRQAAMKPRVEPKFDAIIEVLFQ